MSYEDDLLTLATDFEQRLSECERKNAQLRAQLESQRALLEQAEGALEEIGSAKPKFSHQPSYSGGETYAGFAARLQTIAKSALAAIRAVTKPEPEVKK